MSSTDTTRALSALQAIPADCDRDSWLNVLMAIHDAGLTLDDAISWSESAPSFNLKDLRDVWRGIKPGRVTEATLFYLAKQNGWHDDGKHHRPSAEELAQRQRERKEKAESAAAEKAQRQEAVSNEAQRIWDAAQPAESHPYLTNKGIKPHITRIAGDVLLIPVYDVSGKLWSLQRIPKDGSKDFMTGGKASGCFCTIGEVSDSVVICEGFATGATVHELTGRAVIVAFNSGNLPKVAQALLDKYPDIAIIIGSDDDHKNKDNPGQTKAKQAAIAVDGAVAIPAGFPVDRGDDDSDFNDLNRLSGADAVLACFADSALVRYAAPSKESTSSTPEMETIDLDTVDSEDVHKLRSALASISPSARSEGGKHTAAAVIGYALRHSTSGIDEPVGMALCKEWDARTGGNSASVFTGADPNYAATKPLGLGSIFKMASSAGWVYWPVLQELVSRFESHPYPVDALPESIRDAVTEVQAFMQAPVPMVANSALSALSVAIQGFADVERASKLAGPCSLYTLTIADSGERKTTVDGFFMKPIREYESEVREAKKTDVLRYESDMEVFEAKKSGYKDAIKAQTKNGELTAFTENALRDLEAKERPEKPIIPRWIYSDATPEALANELVSNWPVGALVSSEAGSVLGGAGMSKDSAMRNMARLNELWEGRVPATERVQSKSYSGTEVRFSVSLQIQEKTIRAFFENTNGLARGTGFLARFLLTWPASTMGTRFWQEPPGGWPCLNHFTSRIKEILKEPIPVNSDTGEISPLMHRFSEDGKSAWVTFYNAVEKELGIGGEMTDVKDVASKTADNAARLACIFHVFQGKHGGIDPECVGAASRIALWHLYESRRFFGEIAMPEDLSNAARLESWMVDYCKQHGTDLVPTSAISQCGPTSLRPKQKRDETLTTLVNLGRVRMAKDGKKINIQLRPEVLEGVA